MGSSGQENNSYDLSFKILLIGDSGVGKSSLLLRRGSFPHHWGGLQDQADKSRWEETQVDNLGHCGAREVPDFKTSSYYRNVQGIILVYDVKSRESFMNLYDIWAKEVELYSTNHNCVKMLVGNKVDRDSERVVSTKEGMTLAEETGCLFLECSARTWENVDKCFEELLLQIMEDPCLLEEGSTAMKRNIIKHKQDNHTASACCSG